jgi:hypothetical protein
MMEVEQFDEMRVENDEDDATVMNVTESLCSLCVFHPSKILC